MIAIKKKEDCVGCNACEQRCPKHCISMHEDEQGFFYPIVDTALCINCHLCEKVCPVINQAEPRKPLHTYAAKNKDPEVQRTSSSGGVFFALVEYVITEKQGVVFGARFNDKWEVVHSYAETLEDAKAFKGSKYVQSRIGDNFKKAEDFLKSERTVLFSGTPCQIAGLRRFLRKDYGNKLLLVDTACHGVPSTLVWKDFLNWMSADNGFTTKDVQDISFRDKRVGWDKYGMRINFSNKSERKEWFMFMKDNIYMQGFLKDLYLRPSCYTCPAKCGKSHSDITLADFWGINKTYPHLYNEKYYSLVLCNSISGGKIMNSISIFKSSVQFTDVINSNSAIVKSCSVPQIYKLFWERYYKYGIQCLPNLLRKITPSLLKEIVQKSSSCLKIILSKK